GEIPSLWSGGPNRGRNAAAEQLLAVIAQLGDAVVNVGQRAVVRGLLVHHQRGSPRLGQHLDRRHVDLPVVQVLLDARHVARQEAPVVVDVVTGEKSGAGQAVLDDDGQRLALRLAQGGGGG